MSTTSLPVTSIVPYATLINSQFHKSKSHYVSIADRIVDQTNNEAWKQLTFADAVTEFARRNPTIKSWQDFKFCKAVTVSMDLIDIDATMQRLLDVTHAAKILDNFKQILVMPICVYEDPARPGRYVCWDGQHTSVVLCLIAKNVLNLDLSQCEIPVVIYASSLKSEMRRCFIELNGDAKKPLDPIDIFQQKVFGVRTDGSTDPDWVLNERKQTALENNSMFATHAKFGDTTNPGALTRVDELVDRHYALETTEQFCKYFYYVCGSSRPVRPKEARWMYEFFNMCRLSKITVDDAYISGIATSLQEVGNCDFNADSMHTQSIRSWQEWWRVNKPNPDGSLSGISYPTLNINLTFLFAQIEKNFTGKMPFYSKQFDVPQADLF